MNSRKRARPKDAPDLLMPYDKDLATDRLFEFLNRHRAIFSLFFFGVALATKADEQKLVAAKVLMEVRGNDEDKKRFEEIEKNKSATFEILKKYRDLQSENLCIRLTDNFLCYTSEIIQTCMLRRPEMLRSSETVKIEDILRFSSYDELVSFLVDKKINELSYGGIKEVSAFLSERTGLSLFSTEAERSLLSIGIELRNIYTHNRGVVNDLFMKRVQSATHNFKFEKGKRFHAEFDDIALLANNMFLIATRLDEEAAFKFKLTRKKCATWKKSLGRE